MTKWIYPAIGAAFALAACGEQTTSEIADGAEAGAPAGQSEIDAAAQDALDRSLAYLSQNADNQGVILTDSGLQYQIIEEGPEGGESPLAEDVVEVHYRGVLTTGDEFDSSYARGESAVFLLNGVIEGWTEGVQLMSEGDKFRFFIPPDLAYGAAGSPSGSIGPNEALIFEVELIDVNPGAEEAEAAYQRSVAFLNDNARRAGVMVTETGLQYEIITEGEDGAPSPTERSVVRVHYRGALADGTPFDSSYDRGEPAEFPLNRVIRGWTEGLQLMSVGDTYRFFIPPELGYGARGAGDVIGPNEALIFDVELLNVIGGQEPLEEAEQAQADGDGGAGEGGGNN